MCTSSSINLNYNIHKKNWNSIYKRKEKCFAFKSVESLIVRAKWKKMMTMKQRRKENKKEEDEDDQSWEVLFLWFWILKKEEKSECKL